MSIKTAVYDGAMFLQLDQVCEVIESGETPDDDTKKEIELLTRCANLVLVEIASCYYPLKTVEKVTASGGYIYYENLSKPIIDTYYIKNSAGEGVRFTEYFYRIAVRDGEYEIEYSYACPPLSLDDEIPYKNNRVSDRILAYGIACEYCVISGMVNEASIWQKRYYDALIGSGDKREKKVKARGWL